jgi:heat shock protein HslJ
MRTVLVLTLVLFGCAPIAGTAAKPVSLDGTDWTLTAMSGKAPVAGSKITLTFEQGSASGSAGCNGYHSTTTTTDGAKLKFGMTSSTKRACLAQELNVQETAYLDALSKVAAYEVSGDRLALRDDGSTTLLEFERAR